MLIDFFPASDVVNRVISEFISPGQVSLLGLVEDPAICLKLYVGLQVIAACVDC